MITHSDIVPMGCSQAALLEKTVSKAIRDGIVACDSRLRGQSSGPF